MCVESGMCIFEEQDQVSPLFWGGALMAATISIERWLNVAAINVISFVR